MDTEDKVASRGNDPIVKSDTSRRRLAANAEARQDAFTDLVSADV